MPSFSSFFSRITPGQVHVDEEQREAVVAGVGVGLGDEHDEVGAVAVGDVGLRAVDDPLVAVAHRARLDAGDVGAGVGLGDAEAGDLLALDRRHEVALLLLLGAEQARIGGVAMSVCTATPIARPPRARVRHLLGEHEVAEVVAALAAVLLGLGEAEEAELAHAREDPVGKVVSSHSSMWGVSSFSTKRRMEARRSWWCSSNTG
jgi:hypothetical protein